MYHIVLFSLIHLVTFAQEPLSDYIHSPDQYFQNIKDEMVQKWPNNRTINLVFHGHSVPSGYLTGGKVDRLNSYPFLALKKLKEEYPFAVLNTITTSIGGEQSEQGSERFSEEVLNHRPDILFIDYGLNDRSIGLERTRRAWTSMIEAGKKINCKIVLLTPTPDTTESILDDQAPLANYKNLILELAHTHNVALVDPYSYFKSMAKSTFLPDYMAQNNHINKAGHEIVATLIFEHFKNITINE